MIFRWRCAALSLVALSELGCLPEYFFDEAIGGAAGSAPVGGGGGTTTLGGHGGTHFPAGGGGAASFGGGGSGGEIPTSEDCLNGVDDDDDVLADCADPDCAVEFDCVTPVPEGWEGPYLVATAPTEGALPVCPDGWAAEAERHQTVVNAGPLSCSDCACNAPTGVGCTLPSVIKIGTNTCEDPAGPGFRGDIEMPSSAAWGTCFTESGYGALSGCGGLTTSCLDSAYIDALPQVETLGAGCAATGGDVVSGDTASFATKMLACVQDAAGSGLCADGESCLQKPKSPFFSRYCVAKDGTESCPQGVGWSQSYVFFEGLEDTRGCSECTCGAVTGATCDASIRLYSSSDGSCSGAMAQIDEGTTCDTTNPGTGVFDRRVDVNLVAGACSPASAVSPTGTVTAIGARTYCCED